MLTHKTIWHAIDHLAEMHNLSTSGLARLAGLDPTSFNKSKRVAVNGKLRWPSTESIAKILVVTKTSMNEFIIPIEDNNAPSNHYPHFVQNETGLNRDTIHSLETLPILEHNDKIHLAFEVTQDFPAMNILSGTLALLDMGSALRRNDLIMIQYDKGTKKDYGVGRLTIETSDDYQLLIGDKKQIIHKDICDWASRILWLSA